MLVENQNLIMLACKNWCQILQPEFKSTGCFEVSLSGCVNSNGLSQCWMLDILPSRAILSWPSSSPWLKWTWVLDTFPSVHETNLLSSPWWIFWIIYLRTTTLRLLHDLTYCLLRKGLKCLSLWLCALESKPKGITLHSTFKTLK